MIMCVLLCYPVSIHMSQLQATGRPISSSSLNYCMILSNVKFIRVVICTQQLYGSSPCNWSI